MADKPFRDALSAARTAEAFVMAVADLALADDHPDRLLVDQAWERDLIVRRARALQGRLDSDMTRLLNALHEITCLPRGGAAVARDIAMKAIRSHGKEKDDA